MYQNCIYIFDGAIGEFLMFLSLVDSLNNTPSPSEGVDKKFFVLCNKNLELLNELAMSYPNVIVMQKNSLKTFFSLIVFNLMQKSFIVTFMNFGSEAKSVIIYKKILSFFSLSPIFTFSDKQNLKNNFFYDYSKTFYANISQLSKLFDLEVSTTPPIFKYFKNNNLMEKYNLQNEKYFVVHTFATNAGRSLPVHRWEELLKLISEKYPTTKIFLTGGPGNFEGALAYQINENIINVCDEKDFLATTTLVDNCAIYIGVDTGITHLASLLQKRVIVIGNFSNPTWLPTYSTNSIILGHKENCTCDGKKKGDCTVEENGVKYYRCMYEITNKEILDIM